MATDAYLDTVDSTVYTNTKGRFTAVERARNSNEAREVLMTGRLRLRTHQLTTESEMPQHLLFDHACDHGGVRFIERPMIAICRGS